MFCIHMRSFSTSTNVLSCEHGRTFRWRSTSVASKATMNEAQESALDAPPRTPRESENTLQLLASTGSTVTQWRASSRFVVDGCFSLPCFDNSANEPCNFRKILKCITASFQYLFNISTETL